MDFFLIIPQAVLYDSCLIVHSLGYSRHSRGDLECSGKVCLGYIKFLCHFILEICSICRDGCMWRNGVPEPSGYQGIFVAKIQSMSLKDSLL